MNTHIIFLGNLRTSLRFFCKLSDFIILLNTFMFTAITYYYRQDVVATAIILYIQIKQG